jgi:hypothetical protein
MTQGEGIVETDAELVERIIAERMKLDEPLSVCGSCGRAVQIDRKMMLRHIDDYRSGLLKGPCVSCPRCERRREREKARIEKKKKKYLTKLGSTLGMESRQAIIFHLEFALRNIEYNEVSFHRVHREVEFPTTYETMYGRVEKKEELEALIHLLRLKWNVWSWNPKK